MRGLIVRYDPLPLVTRPRLRDDRRRRLRGGMLCPPYASCFTLNACRIPRASATTRQKSSPSCSCRGFSMMSLASAIEPLRSLNRLAGREAYRWRLASLDGGADRGLERHPACRRMPHRRRRSTARDYLFVCGGLRIQAGGREALSRVAAPGRAARHRGRLALDRHLPAGARRAARRLSLHHPLGEPLRPSRRTFPDLDCTNKIYEIDRDRLTCSGGTAAMDMMLHLIADRHGAELAPRRRQPVPSRAHPRRAGRPARRPARKSRPACRRRCARRSA